MKAKERHRMALTAPIFHYDEDLLRDKGPQKYTLTIRIAEYII